MSSPHQQKEDFLRQHGCLHPHPERVADELFQDSDFFDPRDLVLVKYEMLRACASRGVRSRRRREGLGFPGRRSTKSARLGNNTARRDSFRNGRDHARLTS